MLHTDVITHALPHFVPEGCEGEGEGALALQSSRVSLLVQPNTRCMPPLRSLGLQGTIPCKMHASQIPSSPPPPPYAMKTHAEPGAVGLQLVNKGPQRSQALFCPPDLRLHALCGCEGQELHPRRYNTLHAPSPLIANKTSRTVMARWSASLVRCAALSSSSSPS